MFALFAEALVAGTLDLDGRDPLGVILGAEIGVERQTFAGAATAFSDWLENRYARTPVNPFRKATIAEQIAYWRRLDNRKANALLGYASYRSDHQVVCRQIVRTVGIRRKVTMAIGREVKSFPPERISDLLFMGFARAASSARLSSMSD